MTLYELTDIPLSAEGDALYCPFCGEGWHGQKKRELRRSLWRHLSSGRHDEKIASYKPLRLRTIVGDYTANGDYINRASPPPVLQATD